MIAIVDYQMGNVTSVANAFEALGSEVKITREPADFEAARRIVLPGVGAFGEGMNRLESLGLVPILANEVLRKKKPFLGICLGMQLLAEKGFEFGEHRGLGWVSGNVVKLQVGALRLPHIGWNNLKHVKSSPILNGMDRGADFYFVHSYHFRTAASLETTATCEYGEEFTAVIQKDNLFGVQFHPEKSQKAGRVLLENFLVL